MPFHPRVIGTDLVRIISLGFDVYVKARIGVM